MSIYAIKQYHRELEDLKHYGGTTKETAIRFAFQKLLDEYGKPFNLRLVPEVSIKLKTGKIVTPDGTLKDQLRLDHGYWESKDESDNINEEITNKFSKGYPSDNILFEDSQTAVLFQHGAEVMRTPMEDEAAFDKLLTRYVQFERQEVKDFREAIEKFKEDIPKVTEAIRGIIDQQENNETYKAARLSFLEMCKQSINPDITEEDITEMMVQHILSADIFNTIFDEPHFHQENNIARELNRVIETFFTGATRRQTLGSIKHYYDTINANAAGIADHHEKQKFLKLVYENFYKAYNPKAADRLGIVYTPNEIVHFMIKSTDYLLHKHFGKTLADKNVEILDPATGTGTFICDIIDFLPRNKLAYKYRNELHANEVAILPYYIANLNIEYTYKQKMNEYAEFENLCFVDTLDNTGFHWVGKQGDLFGVSAENAARIRKQNQKKISVIIGNPPYNANQQNENENNKNREYKEIDKRIKDSFIKNSTAQKTKVYDMYSRFYRWAMDRLTENGVIAFITNRSFIDSRTFDGFRKTIQQDFDFAYVIDTKSDVRANPKIAGTTHNVFGIQTGVAVLFLVRTTSGQLKPHNCKIGYTGMDDFWLKDVKLQWFAENPIDKIEFENIVPDKNNNWINLSENAWEELLPICSKDVKAGKSKEAIFELFTLGTVSNRDEWVYDFDRKNLEIKIDYFINEYNRDLQLFSSIATKDSTNELLKGSKIKYTRDLKKDFLKRKELEINNDEFRECLYRVFVKQNLYYASDLNEMRYQTPLLFPTIQSENLVIAINQGSSKPFNVLASKYLVDLHFNGDAQCLPLYRYTKEGQCIENITDWAVGQFTGYYTPAERFENFLEEYTEYSQSKFPADALTYPNVFHEITKKNIFHYVYAVLHHPAYRKKYELNLKREFPRIPFYDNFWQWVQWGEQLMQLHIGYENVQPYNLNLRETEYNVENAAQLEKLGKPKLKANKDIGEIELDGFTALAGIPKIAWEYKLGNRSALEWVLDQYKEKKPGDPTIAEKFNTYRFADYKEQVIDLLLKVCTVSVETMKIVHAMPAE